MSPSSRAIGLTAALALTGCASSSSNAQLDSKAKDDASLSFPDGCTPDCKDKACGATNGCGGVCQTGSCPAGKTCIAGACTCDCPTGCCDANGSCQPGDADGACGGAGGACKDCAAQGQVCHDGGCKVCDRWSASLPGPALAVEVDGDGMIYAAGRDKDKALFAALDHCGTVKKTVAHLPTNAAKVAAHGLVLAGGVLYASGTKVAKTGGDPLNGMWARIVKPGLTVEWMKGLYGGAGKDEAWAIVHAGGALWISGTANIDVKPTVWGVKGQNAKACGFDLLGEGFGRGIFAHKGSAQVYFTGTSAGKGFVARQSDTACAASPCTPCKAPWSITFQDGANSTEGRALLVSGNDLYVAGFSTLGSGDHRGMVFRIDRATGKTLDTFSYNPSSNGELLLAIESDGKALYVAGTQSYGAAAPKAVVIKLSMPGLSKQWVRTPEAGGYWDVELAGTDGLVLGGEAASGGVVRRCLTDGTCP